MSLKNLGQITKEHEENVIAAIRGILKQEEDRDEVYGDDQIADMLRSSGLLVSKNSIYKLRAKHDIPNSRERAIVNFAKRHRN